MKYPEIWNNNGLEAGGGRKRGNNQTDSEHTPLTGSSGRESDKGYRPTHRRQQSFPQRILAFAGIGAASLAVLLSAAFLLASMWGAGVPMDGEGSSDRYDDGSPSGTSVLPAFVHDAGKLYDELGRYVLEDYDVHPPFSDFLPALAGYYGKPLYAFYVNRGQGIASFGTQSKDYPIMEFQSANKAYQSTALVGFRTFIQLTRPRQKTFTLLEPFGALNSAFSSLAATRRSKLPKRYMYIGANELQLQEIDREHELETNVTFFVLPEEDFGAFVKRTTIRNLDLNRPLTLSLLDGLAKIEPAGGKINGLLKSMGRTLEAWMGVYHPYDDSITMPYYRLATQPSDSASVKVQEAGHWCMSVFEQKDQPYLLPIVYDPSKVFGHDTTFIHPLPLYEKHIRDLIQERQYGFAKTSSAFGALDSFTLGPRESLTISTYYGKSNHILEVPVIARRLFQPGFGQYKMSRAREIIKQITAGVETRTAIPLFDGHVQQMYLDNSLRGGVPSILGAVDDEARMRNADEDGRLKIFHFFSRVHGDLERDYNDFVISPTFFSEGPVNFRDVAQNRRNDVIFNPSVGSFNVRTFMSFIQADGYVPLSVEAAILVINDQGACRWIAARAVGEADGHRAQREAVEGILCSGPFRPGQLFSLLEEQHVDLIISRQDFIDTVAAAAVSHPMAVYKEGFWADHWTYFIDLIQSYIDIFPDWEQRLLYEQDLPYYFSPAYVKPREEKYVLSVSFDGRGEHVQQLDSTILDEDKVNYKGQFIKPTTGWYDYVADWQHDARGEIFRTTPMAKLFLLAAIKFATRDAYGMGIEYEAGHPGWNDAENGLVAMLGSGLPETSELLILLRYIRSTVARYKRPISVPIELFEMVEAINTALTTLYDNQVEDPEDMELDAIVPASRFKYWDTVSTAREIYRKKTKVAFDGTLQSLDVSTVLFIIDRWVKEVEDGISRSLRIGTSGKNLSGVSPTYFYYTVTKWDLTGKKNKDGHPLVVAKELRVGTLPLFLEGPTRMMKTVGPQEAAQIYAAVRSSPLRDERLRMYTISASLEGQSVDLGREVSFAPGWLENQSVWMQISYKFYLELIRHGMFAEFFDEMVSGGMLPFIDPQIYGRSLMECSSFIVSSAFQDPSIRGRGFLARLSGTTSEFLSIWVSMMIGPNPFFLHNITGSLQMRLVPALPRWLFKDDEDSKLPYVKFKLFGSIDVTYLHNRGDEDLYRVHPSRYVIGLRDGSVFNVNGPAIPTDLADKIRRVVFVATIDVFFEKDESI